jgi:glycogen debranching enzyme
MSPTVCPIAGTGQYHGPEYLTPSTTWKAAMDSSKRRRVADDPRRMARTGLVSVYRGQPSVHVNNGATFLVAHQDGGIPFGDTAEYGLYADDTRYLSGYELRLNGRPPRPLAFSRVSFRHARWHFLAEPQASPDSDGAGASVAITIDRLLGSRQLHEDLRLRTYAPWPLSLMLTVALESDFADIFEVREGRWQRRPLLTTVWTPPACLETRYQRGDFVRRCLVRTLSDQAGLTHANGQLRFPVDLLPGEEWRVCLQYDLIADDSEFPPLAARCVFEREQDDEVLRQARRWYSSVSRLETSDFRLQLAYDQAIEDFAALRLYDADTAAGGWVPAAGVPWFVALFGRDSAIASLQAGLAQPTFALGTLECLARWQSRVDDPERDAEPGKIPHELRVGEWAYFGVVPHRPYYGTADATPLYLLLLAETYRTCGDAAALERFRPAATRCLDWIDRHGDRDGDGFQEWAPRTPNGYRNQCWRDAEDGVLDERGGLPELPIGTCELQAYVYGAKLGMAPLFAAWGDEERARQLRAEAAELRRRFLEVFWLEPPGEVAFALDGSKRPLRTATSNPGHCLWMGILDPVRGRQAGERLLEVDLFSGWGLRTLSDRHPAYDPHEYQRGSVWPHDTVIAAAGLRRYGMVEHAWRLLHGLLAAVSSFEYVQMPELFSGLSRSGLSVPVPYANANVPQAWGAGAVLHAVQVLLGLTADLPAGRLYVDPALPEWCPSLSLDRVQLGPHVVRLRARRRRDGSSDVDVDAPPQLEIVRGTPAWMDPAR